MKRLLSIIFVSVLALSLILSGCTASSPPSTTAPASPSAPSTSTPSQPTQITPVAAPASPLPSPPVSPPPPVSAPAPGKLVMLTFSSGFPSEDRLEQVFRAWFRKLQIDSGGRIQVSVLDTSGIPQKGMQGGMGGFSSLAEERDYVDWVWCLPEVFSGNLPLWQSLGSFVYGTDINGSLKACTQLFQEFPEMQAEFAKRDLKLMGTFAGYGNSIQTVEKPVRTLSDLKGMKISGGMSLVPILKQFGAVTDNVPAAGMGQEYSIFTDNKGQVDGIITLPEFLMTMKGGEIIKYSTYLHIPYATMDIFCFKQATWNSIPTDLQKVIEDSLPWFYETMTQAQIKVTQDAMDQAKARGTEFIELPQSDLDQILNGCEQQAKTVAAGLDAKGLPGTRMFQRARQIIDDYNKQAK
jgi:TRAP-type transport system periplasmic protein